jgi:hypothetical protein
MRPDHPVLFLDIDGVILSGEELWGSRDPRYIPEWKMQLLNLLCLSTVCRVVVSSTWRSDDGLRERLIAGGFAGQFHEDWRTTRDWVPNEHPRARRGCQIREWLGRHPRTPRYCILDDDCDMLPEQRPFFVKPRFATGLMREHVESAITILNGTADRHPSLWPEVLCEVEAMALAA